MLCKICRSGTSRLFSAQVLRKYDVDYHRCSTCGFIQTDEPFWLDEAYASAITDIDLGSINRALVAANLIEGVALTSFDPNASFIDYGGGYGVLTRLMRDRGYDFRWRDPHCQNLFAQHFVAAPGMRFELLTALEVFEHLADPLAEVDRMLGFAGSILFSTALAKRTYLAAADWWYFAPELGQHVAFYTVAALEAVADRFGLRLSSDGTDFHLLSRRRVHGRVIRFFLNNGPAARLARGVLRRRLRRPSLLAEDFRLVSGRDS